MQLDFDNLPDRNEVEAIINNLDSEETLALINIGRQRMLDNSIDPTEDELRAQIMLVRRLRALRETKSKVRKPAQKKAAAAVPSLDDLL